MRVYVDAVDVAWRWLVSGVVAISVGLAVWWTAFVLIPVGVVLVVIGMTKLVRSTLRLTRGRCPTLMRPDELERVSGSWTPSGRLVAQLLP